MTTITSNYSQYCKPNLHAQLACLSLDLQYFKGYGNYLYYLKGKQEIKVLDFLGGFGALLFGHNHEALVKTLTDSLQSNIPFATQGSDRVEAGELSRQLNRVLRQKLGEDYLTIMSNSGTEAMEVCIKHCLYTHFHMKKKKLEQIGQLFKRMKTGLQEDVQIDRSLLEFLESSFPGERIENDVNTIIPFLTRLNEQALAQPAVLLALEKAFHGKTMGSIQLTYNMEYKQELNGNGINTRHVKNNSTELPEILDQHCSYFYSLGIENRVLKLKKQPFTGIAGFVIEPIQGEGGMNVIKKEYLQMIAGLCKTREIPVVFDEIQTGMGRTGTFLYAEQTGVTPDYIVLSKSLGGGITKTGATLIPRRIFGETFDKIHSSTFAEDGLSSLVALKCIELVENDENFLPNIRSRSEQLKEGISRLADLYPGIIKEIRGAGFMLGLEFEAPIRSGSNCLRLLNDQDMLGYVICGYLLHEFDIRTLPCLSNKNVIRIEPSGYTTEKECDCFLQAIERLCEVLYKENMYEFCKFLVGRPRTDLAAEITCYRNPAFEGEMDECANKVAFIGHFINATDMKDWDRSFDPFTEAELEQLFESIYPMVSPFVSDRKLIRSEKGGKIQFDMLGFIITSKIISKHMKQKTLGPLLEKINDCLQLAETNGYSMVGFGGFTSIITGNCKNIAAQSSNYTTGNSLTTAMGLEAILKQASNLNIDPANSTFAAVGASGNIASVYCEFMALRVRKIILIGARGRLENIRSLAIRLFSSAIREAVQSKNKSLSPIAGIFSNHPLVQAVKTKKDTLTDYVSLFTDMQASMGARFPIVITEDLGMLKEADLILSATNSPEAVIYPETLGLHPVIICDIAVPLDVEQSVYRMKNVRVIKGGIVRVPNDEEFKIPGIILPKGTAYACMSETMLLGLEGIKTNYSYGEISLDQVKQIQEIAKTHGFRLDQPKMEKSY